MVNNSSRIQDHSHQSVSTIDDRLVVQGDVSAKGAIQIDGQVEGNVRADHVAIRGRLVGSVRAQGVILQAACYVAGDVYYHTLTIEQGAHFEGVSRSLDTAQQKLKV